MAKITITNVHVDTFSDQDRKFAIGWEDQHGNRYHFWSANRRYFGIDPNSDRIYKNPPLALKRGEPGYYDTRLLNPASGPCRKMYAEAISVVRRDDLYTKGLAAVVAKRSADNEEWRQKEEKALLLAMRSLLIDKYGLPLADIGHDDLLAAFRTAAHLITLDRKD